METFLANPFREDPVNWGRILLMEEIQTPVGPNNQLYMGAGKISWVVTPVTHLFSAIYRGNNYSIYNW